MWRQLFCGPRGALLCALMVAACTMGIFWAASILDPPTVQAQEADKGAAKDAGKKDALDEDLTGPEPKGEGPKAEATEGAPKSESFLGWLYRSLGLRYVLIFLFITFNLVALMVMNVLAVRRDSVVPPTLIEQFDALVNERRYQEAYELAKASDSFLGKVLAAGMAKLSGGYDAAMEAMQEVGEEENMKLEHRLGYVALCAQIGPMFGLLGTVDGMVMAFDVISKSNTTPKPNQLAQGIGTALVTTIVGLWIAIPAIVYHHILRNRQTKMIREVGIVSENLMKRFATVQPAAKPQPARPSGEGR